jgi:hypothetical protein
MEEREKPGGGNFSGGRFFGCHFATLPYKKCNSVLVLPYKKRKPSTIFPMKNVGRLPVFPRKSMVGEFGK